MLLTAGIALTLTVVVTTYAASRGRSPLLWGGASALVTLVSVGVAWALVRDIGSSDLVFTDHGGGVAMLAALAGPVLALVGNGTLASRLASLPIVRPTIGTRWKMWRVADRDAEGYMCWIDARAEAIVGIRGAEEVFRVPRSKGTVEVDGETLLLRAGDGAWVRLVLMDDDPQDRGARIKDIEAIRRAIE